MRSRDRFRWQYGFLRCARVLHLSHAKCLRIYTQEQVLGNTLQVAQEIRSLGQDRRCCRCKGQLHKMLLKVVSQSDFLPFQRYAIHDCIQRSVVI